MATPLSWANTTAWEKTAHFYLAALGTNSPTGSMVPLVLSCGQYAILSKCVTARVEQTRSPECSYHKTMRGNTKASNMSTVAAPKPRASCMPGKHVTNRATPPARVSYKAFSSQVQTRLSELRPRHCPTTNRSRAWKKTNKDILAKQRFCLGLGKELDPEFGLKVRTRAEEASGS